LEISTNTKFKKAQKCQGSKNPKFCARDVKGLALFVAPPLLRHKKAEAIAEPGTARPGALIINFLNSFNK